jgi:non-ribosomal peptide synthetase component F
MTFRNDKAAEMAFREIVSNLVQTDDETWVHRSGVTVRDYCEAFSKDDEQSFLFKPKVSSGAGTQASKGTNRSDGKKSLFDMSQAEVLKLAAEGKL